MYDPAIRPFIEGWGSHQKLLVEALQDRTPAQLAFRTAPQQWAIWQLAAHVAGARAFWFHVQLGEGDPSVIEQFRVEHTTVPGLSADDAGWEDDEDHPRTSEELVAALGRTWDLIDACLQRWTPEDLEVSVDGRRRPYLRGWVVWHVMEHDVHHGGEISQILGSNGLPGLDF